eukprot:Tbor_TRINITY_DN4101_c0_g1::TRINITY_DN4101_c0_g1_i1::g.26534::m.26534
MPLADPVTPASVRAITTHMMDVVVICRGINDHENFDPLCSETQKALLPIMGLPLIVHCLAPWIDHGCRTFHICHDDMDTTIMEALGKHYGASCGIDFISIGVPFPDDSEVEEWGICDALVEVVNHRDKSSGKNASFSAPACGAGDTLAVAVIDCETILNHMPIHEYLMQFYASYASVAALLWEPPAKNKKSLEEGKKKPCNIPRVFTVLENEKNIGIGASLPNIASSSMGCSGEQKETNASFRRLHAFAREELDYIDTDNAGKAWRFGYLARRPNMEFNFNLSDAACYLMSAWVLRYVRALVKEASDAGSDGSDDMIDVRRLSFTDDVLSVLAKYQHWSMNKYVKNDTGFDSNGEKDVEGDRKGGQKVIQSPAELIGFHCKGEDGGMKPHWALSTNGDGVSVAELNARGHGAPPQHDMLRVMACIVSQPKGASSQQNPTRQYIRIRDKETYLSACTDILKVFGPGGARQLHQHLLHPKVLRHLLEWNAKCVKEVIAKGPPGGSGTANITGSFTQSNAPCTTAISNSIVGEDVVFDYVELNSTKEGKDEDGKGQQLAKGASNTIDGCVGGKTFISGSIIMDGVKIGSGCRIIDTVVESLSVIPSGTRVEGTFMGRNQGK